MSSYRLSFILQRIFHLTIKQHFILSYYSGAVFLVLFPFFSLKAESFLPKGPTRLFLLEAGRAATHKGSEHHLLNPSSFVHNSFSEGSGYFVFGQVPKDYWGISLSENSQIPLAGSFIKELNSQSHFINISAASLITKGWSLGLGVTRWKIEDSYWNAQMGTFISPQGSSMSIGITWDFFLPLKGPFIGHRNYGLGMEYRLTPHMFLRADLVYRPKEKQWILAGNGEIVFSRIFIFSLSSQINFQTEDFLYSGGLGLKGQQMGIHYFLKKNTEEDGEGWIHGITLLARL